MVQKQPVPAGSGSSPRQLHDRSGAIHVDIFCHQHRPISCHAQKLRLGLRRQPSGHAGLQTQVIVNPHHSQRVGDPRHHPQRLEQALQPGRREVVPGEADRTIVGKAEPFQQHDPAAVAQTQPVGDTAVGRKLSQLPDDPRRFLVMPADPLGETRPCLHIIVQHVLGDERAAPLFDPYQTVPRQFLQRPAHGMAVNAEPR
jgi:hypothetical protein